MNSEISPVPESDNTNFEQPELEQDYSKSTLSETELTLEATAENALDGRSELENGEVIEVTLESQSGDVVADNQSDKDKISDSEFGLPELLDSLKPVDDDMVKGSNEVIEEQSKPEPELFVDSWLDESAESEPSIPVDIEEHESGKKLNTPENLAIVSLEERKTELQKDIENLQIQKERILQEQLEQLKGIQENIGRILEEGTKELQERKTALQIEIEKLERRKERINLEMRRNFAGSSQELAVRVQGFKNYLVGSLQDLATAADKLELGQRDTASSRNREDARGMRAGENPRRGDARRSNFQRGELRQEGGRTENRDRGSRRERNRDRERDSRRGGRNNPAQFTQSLSAPTQFSEPTFAEQSRRIRQLLDQYRNSPDYYGPPWQLRRTFEATYAKRVQDWFFTQGGRGAVDSMDSRLQNILVASAAVSIIHALHGDRCRLLVLTDTPENLGEWRRGLMDCLGIARSSFGANRGVMLFDSPEVLIQGAERLLKDKLLPVIIVDETEEMLNLSVLKFPLWLAFASTGKQSPSNYLY